MKWEKGKVFDLCEINPENISRNYPYDYIRYFDITSVGSGVVTINDEIPLSAAPSRAKRVVRNNDTIIATVRPGNRSFYYFKTSFENSIASTGFAVLRPKAEKTDPRFLYYLVSEPFFTAYLVAYEQGANYPAVNPDIIGGKPIEYPPLPTQHRIASILSAYDDLIENNLKRIKLLEEKVILRYKVIVKSEKLEEFAIEEVCQTLGGGTPATGNPQFWNEGDIIWFSPTDLTKHNSFVLLDSEKKITELGLQKSSAKLLPHKTILMTSRASIGYFGLINKESSTNQGFINIIPNKEFYRAYLLFDLKSRKEEIIGNANGSTFLEISKGKFRQMKIKLPKNAGVLIEFEKEFETTFNLIENLLKQNAKLREARDILLPILMNGQIEV